MNNIEVYENVHIVNNHTQWKPFPKMIDNKKPVGIIYTNDDGTFNIVMANSIEEAMKYEFE